MKSYLFSTNTKTILDGINNSLSQRHKYWFKANNEKKAIKQFKELLGENADYVIEKIVEEPRRRTKGIALQFPHNYGG